jgi:hypothetical protein
MEPVSKLAFARTLSLSWVGPSSDNAHRWRPRYPVHGPLSRKIATASRKHADHDQQYVAEDGYVNRMCREPVEISQSRESAEDRILCGNLIYPFNR